MRVELVGKIRLLHALYPKITDANFHELISQREEFAETRMATTPMPTTTQEIQALAEDVCDTDFFTLAPHQRFVRNFLASRTPYNGLLLYHGLGTGKTCSAITIAEDFRVSYPDARIYVVGNEAIQDNFRKQLFRESMLEFRPTGWVLNGCSQSILRDLNLVGPVDKSMVVRKAKDMIATHYTFLGYEKLSKEIRAAARSVSAASATQHLRQTYRGALFIIDEVHNFLRESTRDFLHMLEATTVKLLLLSATPMYGEIDDIVQILNLLKVNDKVPAITYDTLFDGERLRDGALADHARGYVSFVKGENPYSFPYRVYPKQFEPSAGFDAPANLLSNSKSLVKKVDHIGVYPVTCSDFQAATYAKALASDQATGKISKVSFRINALMSLNMSYPGHLYGKTGLSRALKLEKGVYSYKGDACFHAPELEKYSAKLSSLMHHLATAEGIVLVYTQFIKGGAIPTALALEAAGYRRYNQPDLLANAGEPNGMHYAVLSGDAVLSSDNAKEIEVCVSRANTRGELIKVIILTRAASEGVDLKNVRQIHILDPWWHMERIEQIIGRGVRWCSHKSLPFRERNVMIFLYATVFAPTSEAHGDEALDMYMYRWSESKAISIGKITRELKKVAVDCLLNSPQNMLTAARMRVGVQQRLSNGTSLRVALGEQAFSASCDYLETCLGDDEDLSFDLPLVKTDVPLTDTSEPIKHVFRTYRVLERDDLIRRVSHISGASPDAVDETLLRMVAQREHVLDPVGSMGYIVNFGTLFMFQPLNLPETISMYERRVLPTPVPRAVSVTVAEVKRASPLLELERQFAAAMSGKDGIGARLSAFKASVDAKRTALLAYFIERLEFNECSQLLGEPTSTEFGKLLKQYFDTHCLVKGFYVLWFTQTALKAAPELSLRFFRGSKEASFLSVDDQLSIESLIHARASDRAATCGTVSPVNRGEGSRIFKVISDKNPGVACSSVKLGTLKQLVASMHASTGNRNVICQDLELALRLQDRPDARSFLSPIEYIVAFPKKEKR